ncbi:MAG: DUF523 domain-containing protein [Zetaproteobacteria bacterium]|nr:MAG: DUF523 domain-containing protein [Zetaproteobacteria bacterium]
MQKILVSACLLGEKVRYDGADCAQQGLLQKWQREGRVVPYCPEVSGGLEVPRPPAEIEGGDAEGVLRGERRVLRHDGKDVTHAFIAGAERALADCWRHQIKIAILKEGSPSCGVCEVRDGSFSGRRVNGQGVTARLLARHGISVFHEGQIEQAAKRLAELDASMEDTPSP